MPDTPDKICLFDHWSYIDPDDFREVIEEQSDGVPFDEMSDDEKWSMLALMEEQDYEDEKENIASHINGRIIALGTAGLWYGSPEGGFIASDLQDAIYKMSGNTSGYIGFYVEDGELHMTFAHHDGTHDLILRCITDAGERYIDDMEYELAESDIEKDVFNDPAYSVPINVL